MQPQIRDDGSAEVQQIDTMVESDKDEVYQKKYLRFKKKFVLLRSEIGTMEAAEERRSEKRERVGDNRKKNF